MKYIHFVEKSVPIYSSNLRTRDKYFGKANRISLSIFIYFMLVRFSFSTFIDIRILPINQPVVEIYKYMLQIDLHRKLMSYSIRPVSNIQVRYLRWIHIVFSHLHWFCRIVTVKESTLYSFIFDYLEINILIRRPNIFCILGSKTLVLANE